MKMTIPSLPCNKVWSPDQIQTNERRVEEVCMTSGHPFEVWENSGKPVI